MITVLLTLVAVILAVLLMAVGVLCGRTTLSPGCGGSEGNPPGSRCVCTRRCVGLSRRASP